MTRLLLIALVLAAPVGAQDADSTAAPAPADSTPAVQRAQAVAFDSMLTARAEVIVARVDSVRQARADARPAWRRWLVPVGIGLGVLAALAGAAGLMYWLADRKLAASETAIAQATAAARNAEGAASGAARATESLRGDIQQELARAEQAAAQAARQLERVRAMLDQDDRADRFRDVFRQFVREPSEPPRP